MTASARGSRSDGHEPLAKGPVRIDDDQHHGLLSEDERDLGGELLRPSKQGGAAALLRPHDHFDHVPILATSLPNAARLEERRVLELALDQARDGIAKHARVERDRQLLVATRLAGHTSPDVETDDAGRLDRHTTIMKQEESERQGKCMRQTLEQRVGRWEQRRFYLYFEIDQSTGQLSIETSWLPDMSEVQNALTPLGFCRSDADGTYRATLNDAADLVGILRRATKALTLLLEEATP